VLLVVRLAESVGASISARGIFGAILTLAVVFLLPTLRGWGLKVRPRVWNVAGLAVAVGYVLVAAYLHGAALTRVKNFVALEHLEAKTIGALPFPPSIFHWDGLVRTPRGVYEMRVNLKATSVFSEAQAAKSNSEAPAEISYSFYPDAVSNFYIEAAKRLPEVQKVLWFSRFPVIRFHKEGTEAIVEIADLRFPQIRRGRPAAFTYRVRFNANGQVLSKGWMGSD
jgi:hypothetical protein